MKKFFALLLCVFLVGGLFACGEKDTPTEISATESETQESIYEQEQQMSNINDEQTEIIEDEPEQSIQVPWQNLVFAFNDRNGYLYKATLRISPWILQSNTDVIESAWNEIESDRSLPSVQEWKLNKYSDGRFGRPLDEDNTAAYIRSFTDFYYSIGTIQIDNITDGWSFSESNIGGTACGLYIPDSYAVNKSGILSMVYYGDSTKEYNNHVKINPSMKTDSWGPVTFILAHPENFSPAYPNGEYREALSELSFDFSPHQEDVSDESYTFQITFYE